VLTRDLFEALMLRATVARSVVRSASSPALARGARLSLDVTLPQLRLNSTTTKRKIDPKVILQIKLRYFDILPRLRLRRAEFIFLSTFPSPSSSPLTSVLCAVQQSTIHNLLIDI